MSLESTADVGAAEPEPATFPGLTRECLDEMDEEERFARLHATRVCHRTMRAMRDYTRDKETTERALANHQAGRRRAGDVRGTGRRGIDHKELAEEWAELAQARQADMEALFEQVEVIKTWYGRVSRSPSPQGVG